MKKHKQTNKKTNNWDATENALILEGHRLKMTLEKWGVEQTQAQPRDWAYPPAGKPREIHRKPTNLTSSWDQKLGTKPQPAVPSQATLAERLQRQQMREVSCRWRSSEGSEWALNLLPPRPNLSTQPSYPELSSQFQHWCPTTDARSAAWSKEVEWTWFLKGPQNQCHE